MVYKICFTFIIYNLVYNEYISVVLTQLQLHLVVLSWTKLYVKMELLLYLFLNKTFVVDNVESKICFNQGLSVFSFHEITFSNLLSFIWYWVDSTCYWFAKFINIIFFIITIRMRMSISIHLSILIKYIQIWLFLSFHLLI